MHSLRPVQTIHARSTKRHGTASSSERLRAWRPIRRSREQASAPALRGDVKWSMTRVEYMHHRSSGRWTQVALPLVSTQKQTWELLVRYSSLPAANRIIRCPTSTARRIARDRHQRKTAAVRHATLSVSVVFKRGNATAEYLTKRRFTRWRRTRPLVLDLLVTVRAHYVTVHLHSQRSSRPQTPATTACPSRCRNACAHRRANSIS